MKMRSIHWWRTGTRRCLLNALLRADGVDLITRNVRDFESGGVIEKTQDVERRWIEEKGMR